MVIMWLIQHKIIITKPASHRTMSHILLPLSHHNQSNHLARIRSAIKYQFRGYLNFKTHFPPHLARIPNTGHLPSGGTCHNCSFFRNHSLSLTPSGHHRIDWLPLACFPQRGHTPRAVSGSAARCWSSSVGDRGKVYFYCLEARKITQK